MSLLLKALKQAEAANGDRADLTRQGDGDLELETQAAPAASQQRQWAEPPGLLFGNSGLIPEPQRATGFNWPRLSLVPLATLLAVLVALGYGIYLYFALQPPSAVPSRSASTAAPAAPAADPAAIEPAPVALPETDLPQMPLLAAQVNPAPVPPAAVPPHRAASHTSDAAPPAALPQFRPDPQTTLLAEAYAAYQRGALDEAQPLYAQAAANGHSVDALLGLAAIASIQNREADAQRLYREVLDLDPHNPAAQGALLDLLGNTDSVATESRLKTLIEREPSPQLHQTLGNLYADQGRWGDAQAAYFEAWRGAPDNADYAFNLAVSLDQLRQYSAARTYYEKALASGGVHRFDRAQAEARMQQLNSAR